MQAAELADAGNHVAARARLQTLLHEQPRHLAATLDLARLTLHNEADPVETAQVVGQAIVAARRSGDNVTPQQLYADLKKRFPNQQLDARSLFAVAEATQADDAAEAVMRYRALI